MAWQFFLSLHVFWKKMKTASHEENMKVFREGFAGFYYITIWYLIPIQIVWKDRIKVCVYGGGTPSLDVSREAYGSSVGEISLWPLIPLGIFILVIYLIKHFEVWALQNEIQGEARFSKTWLWSTVLAELKKKYIEYKR